MNNFLIPFQRVFDLGNLHNMSYYFWIHNSNISTYYWCTKVSMHVDFLGGP